jgi:hypothetical protein
MTKDEFREMLTRYLADAGIQQVADPQGLRNVPEMETALNKFRDRLARKLYERYEYPISWDDFYADWDGVGTELKPDTEEDKY